MSSRRKMLQSSPDCVLGLAAVTGGAPCVDNSPLLSALDDSDWERYGYEKVELPSEAWSLDAADEPEPECDEACEECNEACEEQGEDVPSEEQSEDAPAEPVEEARPRAILETRRDREMLRDARKWKENFVCPCTDCKGPLTEQMVEQGTRKGPSQIWISCGRAAHRPVPMNAAQALKLGLPTTVKHVCLACFGTEVIAGAHRTPILQGKTQRLNLNLDFDAL